MSSWYEARAEAGREAGKDMLRDGDFDSDIVDMIIDGEFDDAVQERFHKIELEAEDSLSEYLEELHQDKILAQQEIEDYAKDDSPYEPDDRWEGEC